MINKRVFLQVISLLLCLFLVGCSGKKEQGDAASALRGAFSGDDITLTEKLQKAFSDYYNDECSYELRFLPYYEKGGEAEWNGLTRFIAVAAAYQGKTTDEGLSAEVFEELVGIYFGDMPYTDKSSDFLNYEDGFYTYTGWDTNGAVFYRLTDISRQEDCYTASFDGVSFSESDFFVGEEFVSPNMKAVLKAAEEEQKDITKDFMNYIDTLMLSDAYDDIFTVSERVSVTFRLSDGKRNPFEYLSCERYSIPADIQSN